MPSTNQKLAEILNDDSFTRWINGNASYSEKQRWEAWEQEDLAHEEIRSYAVIFYQMRMELDSAEDLEVELNRLNQRIAKTKERRNLNTTGKVQRLFGLGGYRISVAATILLLVSIAGLFFFYNPVASYIQSNEPLFETIETGYGETSLLNFSDGSSIRLNAKSSLRYNLEQFSSDKVEVWLRGEGYFDIASNPGDSKRKFILHTDDGKIEVLGTKFNVDTRFKKTSVVLEEGRVEVSMNSSGSMQAPGKILQPGERAVIDNNSSDIVLHNVDVAMFTAWIDGEMEFRNTSLEEIFTAIEATYNVKLEVESPELLKRQITGIVQNPDLQILLTGLQEILDLKIKQVKNKTFLISRQ